MSKQLGDKVGAAIKTVLPTLAEANKDCPGCKKRKKWLNNVGAKFSSPLHTTK